MKNENSFTFLIIACNIEKTCILLALGECVGDDSADLAHFLLN